MTAYQATAKIFLTAFMALPRKAQNAILFPLVHDPEIREDIIDLAIAEKRVREKARPLGDFLSELKPSRRRR